MQLMTKALQRALPPLQAGRDQGVKALVYVHYFTSYSNWDWYATAFDGSDICFGLVKGFALEFGEFSLSELKGVRILGCPIERDLYWEPQPVGQILAMWQKQGFYL